MILFAFPSSLFYLFIPSLSTFETQTLCPSEIIFKNLGWNIVSHDPLTYANTNKEESPMVYPHLELVKGSKDGGTTNQSFAQNGTSRC
jgi:hypothetical protein